MLKRTLIRLPFVDAAPDPRRVACHTAGNRPLGRRGVKEGNFRFTRDDLAYEMPGFAGGDSNIFNRHTMKHLGKAKPLKQKVQCPWCHTFFPYTYEEYRRDPALQDEYQKHEDSHAPPPGWEPDPRPMKGKGVTQYDARHRFGWMLGEEW
eukprot:TRINITY_DN25498_c0_g1_i1.p2 TRINITY_DN25498_c0_g1~~TRINITY_DN25498_c0_g1_i1.p2  ORF type:complete len:150 (+),score=26.32 TRINITY_DN25498_c0_g1_i1:48-497(+)